MAASYEEFFVYDLKDNGEKKKLDIKQEDLQNYLHPEQVLVIIREDLRRIFIWKGAKSPVRKRFISSRVARDLQQELLDDPRYHRCKIISVDQGDEQKEFLDTFQLKSMEVEERLPDMRYIRNIERERMKSLEGIVESNTEKPYFSPALQDTSDDIVVSSIRPTHKLNKPSTITKTIGLSKEEQQKVKNKILENAVPENHKRQNLILGHLLFAAVSKRAKIFDEEVEEIVWEPVKKIPKNRMDLDSHKLRVYFDSNKGIVQAVEILKKEDKLDKEKQTEPKKSPSKNSKNNQKSSLTPIPQKPNSLKDNSKVQEKEQPGKNLNSSNRRQLPKIPSEKE